jgi:uncharacterized protein (DUF2164 family)
MATSKPGSKIELTLTVNLSEAEVRAFDALVGYGTDQFLEFFYKNMGTAYMKPNEQGLRDLFATMRGNCADAIQRIDAARKAFATENYVVKKKEPTQ